MRGRWMPVLLPVALVAGCGSAAPARPADGDLIMAAGVSRVTPAAGTDVGPLVTGMTAFGHDLLGAMGPDAEGNMVISPLSIAYAFGMAEAGAQGETREQIDKVFGFGPGGPHEQINALTQRIGATDAPPTRTPKTTPTPGEPPQHQQPVMSIANGLFVQQAYPVKDDYLKLLATQYGAGARPVDFAAHPDAAAKTINHWADQQTAGRIKDIVHNLDPATRLVLTNAVYLKADWASGFHEYDTAQTAFHADGRDVKVPMMRQTKGLRYASGPGWQAVELPYANSDLAMWIMVPTGSAKPLDLLGPETLGAVGDNLRPAYVDLALPRWDFGQSKLIDLKKPLLKLGMTVPFSWTGADFHGMSDEQLAIGAAEHRANITVDEDGTEAAAVTAVEIVATSAHPAPRTVTVRADRPFAFAIVHTPTHAPLFVGQVADPTQH